MTNEEAIKLLKWILAEGKECEDLEYHGVSVKEAIEMAVKALEQTDGDLISRKAVLDMMNKIFFGKDFVEFRVEYGSQGAMYYAMNFVKKLPTIPSAEKTDGDLITEIDKLPRIKVGNSNSPTVKYCIDEVLLYDLLEHYKESEEEE